MAGQEGFEPTTFGFGDRRSTIGATGLQLFFPFFMKCMLLIKLTILFYFQLRRRIFFIPRWRIVLALTLGALQIDYLSHGIGVLFYWSPGADLNCRPLPYQGSTLPLSYPGSNLPCARGMVGRGGFEPPKAVPTDLQSVPFSHSGTSPLCQWWCWLEDSNSRPADYKSAALPIELSQHFPCLC